MIPVMRPWLGEDEAAAAAEAVRSGWVAQGPRVGAFEEAFAARVGAAHGVAVSSCTTGLHLALHLLGAGPGDEVVVPSLSFVATANSVRQTGATPVFADVDPDTGNLDATCVERMLTRRTVAIMTVHQGGVPADLEALREVATGRDLALLEDAACAAGSTYRGAPVGSGALLAAWSFHPRKVLTTGEGGMVTTENEAWADRLRRLREHGMNVSAADRHRAGAVVLEQYLEPAFNYRMTDIQAAVGLVQLAKLDTMVARRRELAGRYHAMLADLDWLRCVRDPAYGRTNYQSFWVEVDAETGLDNRAVLDHLAAAGVSARRGIMAAHLEPAYAGHPHGPLPITERLTRQSVILPMFHTMTEAEQQQVVDALRSVVRGRLPAGVAVGA